jgi:hypothetical protein
VKGKSPKKSILRVSTDQLDTVKLSRSKDKHLNFAEQQENESPGSRKRRFTEKEYSENVKSLLGYHKMDSQEVIHVDYTPENMPLRPLLEHENYRNIEKNVSTSRLHE